MADAPLSVVTPPELVYRVGRGFDAFAPPDWAYALPDGTFGNRFDDPSAERDVPEGERYRVVYCATERAGAFGETIARFRPSVGLLAGLAQVEDEEPFDPELEGGVVPEEWRLSRRVGSTRLASEQPFVDLAAPETMRVLRKELAAVADGMRVSAACLKKSLRKSGTRARRGKTEGCAGPLGHHPEQRYIYLRSELLA